MADETKPEVEDVQETTTDAQDAAVQDPPGPVDDVDDDEDKIKDVQFPELTDNPQDDGKNRNMDLILDISVPVSVELGRTNMLVKDILSLTHGSVVELEKLAGSPVDLLVRGKLLAQGEVVVVGENFGLKITNICGSEERVKNLA